MGIRQKTSYLIVCDYCPKSFEMIDDFYSMWSCDYEGLLKRARRSGWEIEENYYPRHGDVLCPTCYKKYTAKEETQ